MNDRNLTDQERGEVRRWLRTPRGRYAADRASQLAGVPRSTIYDWNRNAILVPDFAHARPMEWSYRDLVFLRLTAWLRIQGMPRPFVANRVRFLRERLNSAIDDATIVRSDGRVFPFASEEIDHFTGAQVISGMLELRSLALEWPPRLRGAPMFTLDDLLLVARSEEESPTRITTRSRREHRLIGGNLK
jgi:hypothetical protein